MSFIGRNSCRSLEQVVDADHTGLGVEEFPEYRQIKTQAEWCSRQVGKAMLKVARKGASKRVLESEDINAI